MRKSAAALVLGVLVAWMLVANVAHANGVMNTFTLHFDNLDLDLGLATQIDVDNEYLNAWGVRFNKVYRYIDYYDPFVDPGQLPTGGNFGIANGNLANLRQANVKGQIHFEYGSTSFFQFDWWTVGAPMSVMAYDAAGNLVDDFYYAGVAAGAAQGSATLYGDISSVIFHDDGGTVAIANMTYESAIPEPGTLGLLGMGLAGLAAASRRRKKSR